MNRLNQTITANYHKIEQAIHYLQIHFKKQPNLEEIAEKIGLSPFHFQRLFSDFAGVSPKQFIQFLSVEYAKSLLVQNKRTLFDTAHKIGLSGTGRLHDLFVHIEGMSPGEYKNGGKNLQIYYSFHQTLFGNILAASTYRGLCYLVFVENEVQALFQLKTAFPAAQFMNQIDNFQALAVNYFNPKNQNNEKLKLHLKGTEFQIKVWNALMQIPEGKLSSYSNLAKIINNPNAARAVGTAIGDNPIAYIIPCHRVIQASGIIGHYHWGSARKAIIIATEAAYVK